MSDSVKFIFKCLIKTPIYILISYLLANLFLFSMFYFKFLGVSYAVMQTALENNYIPSNEMTGLTKSVNDIYRYPDGSVSQVIPSAEIFINVDGSDTTYNNDRRQYGNQIVVGVKYKYRWIWPLMPEEYGQVPADIGSLRGAESGVVTSTGNEDKNIDGKSSLSEAELDRLRKEKADKGTNEIKILYKVPGLQYYSDLE